MPKRVPYPEPPFIPYLGPEAIAARGLGVGVTIACGIAGVASAVRAVLYLQRVHLLAPLANIPAGETVLEPIGLSSNTSHLNDAELIFLVATAAAVILDVIWRRRRRPSAVLDVAGETHVPSPVAWAIHPRWLIGPLILFVAGFLVSLMHRVRNATTFSARITAYHWASTYYGLWAAAWLAWGLRALLIMQSDQRRLQRSVEWRAAPPGSVAFHPRVGDREAAKWIADAAKARKKNPNADSYL